MRARITLLVLACLVAAALSQDVTGSSSAAKGAEASAPLISAEPVEVAPTPEAAAAPADGVQEDAAAATEGDGDLSTSIEEATPEELAQLEADSQVPEADGAAAPADAPADTIPSAAAPADAPAETIPSAATPADDTIPSTAAPEDAAATPAAADAASAPAADDGATPPAAEEAAGAAAPKIPEDSRWAAMVQKIADMQNVCKAFAEKWQCNAGTHKCIWDETQTPKCVVPESYVKARLIESVPCPGSLMESWFACTAANNDKAACQAKDGCTWTDWANYTSLPLPTRRKLLADPVPVGVNIPEAGACQLAEIYSQRKAEEWDALSNLGFQISHLDLSAWGDCATVSELKTLVPPSSRQPCGGAKSEEVCGIAAPLCAWVPRITPAELQPEAGEKRWPTGACETTCNTTDRPTCAKYETCGWNATAAACGVQDGSLEAAAPPADDLPAADLAADAAGRNSSGPELCGEALGFKNITCAADITLQDAVYSLIELSKKKAEETPIPAAAPEPASKAPVEAPKNAVTSARAAAGSVAAVVFAVLLLAL